MRRLTYSAAVPVVICEVDHYNTFRHVVVIYSPKKPIPHTSLRMKANHGKRCTKRTPTTVAVEAATNEAAATSPSPES